MDGATRAALESVNLRFYDEHAASFSQTRDHPWPGWKRIAERIPQTECALLDAGCGNGRFGRFLAAEGRTRVHYTGVDASDRLLEAARIGLEDWDTASCALRAGDVFAPAASQGPFDAIVLFGVLHHVAGFAQRVECLARLGARLTADGFLAATLWRFADDPRARTHRADLEAWFAARGVEPDSLELEPGDALLEWGGSPGAVRYCHFVDDEEVDRLVAATEAAGLRVVDRFRSDGRSGDLNEYVVFSRRTERN